MPGPPGGDPARDDLPRAVGHVDELPVHLHPAGLDPGDVEQLGDQPCHPVGGGVDRLDGDELMFVSAELDGARLDSAAFEASASQFLLPHPPQRPFKLKIETFGGDGAGQ